MIATTSYAARGPKIGATFILAHGAGAGMRVEKQKPALLALHGPHQRHEHRMLEDVAEIARVVTVAVVHTKTGSRRTATQSTAAQPNL